MQIVEKLKALVATERKITAEIIEHIQRIDQEKIFLKMGFPNLYSFLTAYIGYTAAAAQRRIEASRLLSSVPEVKDLVKSGELNLSQVALVAQSIRQKQKESPEVKFDPIDKKNLLDSVKGLSLELSQKLISQTLDIEIKDFEKQKIQQDDSIRLEFNLSKEQFEMLNKIKSLMSHVMPNASTADVFEYLAKDFLKRKDPSHNVKSKYRNITSKEKTLNAVKNVADSKASFTTVTEANPHPKSSLTSVTEVLPRQKSSQILSVNKSRKAISKSIKRAVWQRDQGQCQHFNPTTGKLCGSNHLLEYDHIKRYSHGGNDSAQNLRLLCKAHNLWRG